MISKQKQPSKPKDKNHQKDVSMKSGNKYRFMQKQQDEQKPKGFSENQIEA